MHRKSSPKKRVPSAEAPVTTEEIMQMKDPLDFLAKYCIIRYTQVNDHITSSVPAPAVHGVYFASWTLYVKKEIFTKLCVFLTLRLLFYFPSKDRLPFYERIYRNVVSSQPERYERQHPLSPTTGMPVTEGTSWGKHELGMFHDLILISRGQEPKRPVSEGQGLYYMYYKMEICIMQDHKIFWKHEISVDCIVTVVVFLSLSDLFYICI